MAQELCVLVDQTRMVAERFQGLRSPVFSPAAFLALGKMVAEGFVGTPSFEHNMAAQITAEQNVEDIALLAAVVLTARVSINLGGQIISYVWDKVQKTWTRVAPQNFDDVVETCNLSNSVSLGPLPVGSPDGSKQDEEVRQQKWVAKEIERLNKKDKEQEERIVDLQKRNDVQQRLLSLYNKEREREAKEDFDKEQEAPQQVEQIITIIDIIRKMDEAVDEKKPEDLLFTKNCVWAITKAIEVFADHIREVEARGDTVNINETNAVNGVLVHNLGKLLREELGRDLTTKQTNKAKTLQDVRAVDESNMYNTLTSDIRLQFAIPGTDESSVQNSHSQSGDKSMPSRDINQLANRDDIRKGGDRSPGDPSGGDINTIQNKCGGNDDGDDRKRREFPLVKAYNINIAVFTSFNLNNNPYIPFNEVIRKLILTQGGDGEELLGILDYVETYGDDKFTNAHLKALPDVYPRAYEYARAVNAALLNWTGGAVEGLVEHGCENGMDAWRRRYSRYIPGAEDLQHLLVEELMLLKPVNENEVDALFSEVERITEWYIKIDSKGEAMNAKWVRAALNLFCMPTGVLAFCAFCVPRLPIFPTNIQSSLFSFFSLFAFSSSLFTLPFANIMVRLPT